MLYLIYHLIPRWTECLPAFLHTCRCLTFTIFIDRSPYLNAGQTKDNQYDYRTADPKKTRQLLFTFRGKNRCSNSQSRFHTYQYDIRHTIGNEIEIYTAFSNTFRPNVQTHRAENIQSHSDCNWYHPAQAFLFPLFPLVFSSSFLFLNGFFDFFVLLSFPGKTLILILFCHVSHAKSLHRINRYCLLRTGCFLLIPILKFLYSLPCVNFVISCLYYSLSSFEMICAINALSALLPAIYRINQSFMLCLSKCSTFPSM